MTDEIQLSEHCQSKWNRPSQTSTQHRQYWPNSFKPSNKPIDIIPMGKMVDGFNGVQRWGPHYSDRHYTMQKLVNVSMSKAWWTEMVHNLGLQRNILIKLFPSY
jgi:hypothetical protein